MSRHSMLVAFLAQLLHPGADACTAIAIGRGATVEGSGLVTHNNDCAECDPRVAFVAAKDHQVDAKRPVQGFRHAYPRVVGTDRSPTYAAAEGQQDTEPMGFVDQVPRTYAYWESTYPLINEHGLGFGESTCFGKLVGQSKAQGGSALFCVGELMRVAAERCKDARCAVSLMGGLAVEHGFYGEDPGMDGAGETVVLVDNAETWVFHVTGGLHNTSATWVAQRVPDDHVAAIANSFIIRGVNCEDRANFLCSDNLFSNARALGLCDLANEADFDWLRCYSPYTPNLMLTLRQWRVQSLANPEAAVGLTVDTYAFPFSVPVAKKVSRGEVMNWTRDHYKGTPYDMTQGVQAGPHGNPNREEGGQGLREIKGQFARGISIMRTNSAVVVEGKSGEKAKQSIAWFATDQPISSVFVPFAATSDRAAASYSKGHLETFSRESAFWAFNFVSNWMMLNWESMMSLSVGPAQQEEQDRILSAVAALESQWPADPSAVSDFQQGLQESLIERWWLLADHLVASYSDAIFTRQNTTKMGLGYPAWWLQMIGFNQGFYQAQWVQPSVMPPRLLWDSLPWWRVSASTFLSADQGLATARIPEVLAPALVGALVGASAMFLVQRRQVKLPGLRQTLLQ